MGPQEGVHVRQARGDDGTVRGRFLPAEERIGNWTTNLKADAARQRHLHREAEDDIVRKLIQLLPKFDVLSTVRDAMRIAEELASDGDRLATASEFRRLRD